MWEKAATLTLTLTERDRETERDAERWMRISPTLYLHLRERMSQSLGVVQLCVLWRKMRET